MPPTRKAVTSSKVKTSKYVYKTIKELLDEGRPEKRSYHHVYGVIIATAGLKSIVTIKDETGCEVVIHITSAGYGGRNEAEDIETSSRFGSGYAGASSKGPREFFDPDKVRQNKHIFHVGDVIRFHRLMTSPDNDVKLCFDIRSIVVFPSFTNYDSISGKHELLVKSMASDTTIEKYDEDRFKQLQEWLVQEILKESLSTIPVPTKGKGINVFGQLVRSVGTIAGHKVLWLWDGTEPNVAPQELEKKSVYTMSEKRDALLEHQSKGKTVMVTIANPGAGDVDTIVPGDFVVLFNVSVRRGSISGQSTSAQTDKQAVSLVLCYDPSKGMTLRKINKQSLLGQKLQAKLESEDFFDAESNMDEEDEQRIVTLSQNMRTNPLFDPGVRSPPKNPELAHKFNKSPIAPVVSGKSPVQETRSTSHVSVTRTLRIETSEDDDVSFASLRSALSPIISPIASTSTWVSATSSPPPRLEDSEVSTKSKYFANRESPKTRAESPETRAESKVVDVDRPVTRSAKKIPSPSTGTSTDQSAAKGKGKKAKESPTKVSKPKKTVASQLEEQAVAELDTGRVTRSAAKGSQPVTRSAAKQKSPVKGTPKKVSPQKMEVTENSPTKKSPSKPKGVSRKNLFQKDETESRTFDVQVPDSVVNVPSTSGSGDSDLVVVHQKLTPVATDNEDIESEFEGPTFPAILDCVIPPAYFSIDEYLRIIQVNDWMSIHAHAIECSVESHTLGDIIFLECSKCKYSDTLSNVLGTEASLTAYLLRVNGLNPKDIERINCPRCFSSIVEGSQKKDTPKKGQKRVRSISAENVPQVVPMKFTYKIVFVLQSSDLSTLLVSLEGFAAIKVFGITPQRALCNQKEAKEKLFNVLDTICPESWEDKRRPENVLNWVIKLYAMNPQSETDDPDNILLNHSVLTVTPVCSSQIRATSVPEVVTKATQCDANVGCNLSGRSVLGEKHYLFDGVNY